MNCKNFMLLLLYDSVEFDIIIAIILITIPIIPYLFVSQMFGIITAGMVYKSSKDEGLAYMIFITFSICYFILVLYLAIQVFNIKIY